MSEAAKTLPTSVRIAGPQDVAAMAAVHAAAFDEGAVWSASSILNLLEAPGTYALVSQAKPAGGFIIMRVAAGEAEVLTIAVAPNYRRAGIGRALVLGGLAAAIAAQCNTVFLEVAADNEAARALYESLDFAAAGLRKGYYARAGSEAVDALILRWTAENPDKT